MKHFYVYAYLREDQTPYYIGKGKANRAWISNNRTVHKPSDDRIIIIKDSLTEVEAFEEEKRLIEYYGRKDLGTGILHNRTNGGDGVVGAIRSEEWKQNHSETMKQKMVGSPSPMQGRKQTAEHIHKRMEAHRGAKRSKETCEKIRKKAIGRTQTAEQIQKRFTPVTCTHCGKTMDAGNHNRWHGNNCKHKR